MTNSIFLFLNLSGSELLVIVVVAFLIFGPSKFPEIGRKVGKFMRDAKKATSDITKEFESESNLVKNEISEVKKSISALADEVNANDPLKNTTKKTTKETREKPPEEDLKAPSSDTKK